MGSGALWDGNRSGASWRDRAAAAGPAAARDPGLGSAGPAEDAGGQRAAGAVMNAAVVRRTQEALGKVIRRPPLTEKLLSKPPFRYLHDIITEVGAGFRARPGAGRGSGGRRGQGPGRVVPGVSRTRAQLRVGGRGWAGVGARAGCEPGVGRARGAGRGPGQRRV